MQKVPTFTYMKHREGVKREGIGPCVCCAVRMVHVVLTQRRSEEGRDRTMCMLCCTYVCMLC